MAFPAYDTFARVFAALNPEQFQQCFLNWVRSLSQQSQAQVIAIDGKTLRQSRNPTDGKRAIHRVSAWATANRLVLGQRQVDEKSNEITAIPQGCDRNLMCQFCQAETTFIDL